MTYIIEPQIERYINKTVDIAVDKAMVRTRAQFQKDMEHHTGALSEEFQSRLKSMGETIDLKIKKTTRDVIQEEVNPRFERLETKVDMIVKELQESRIEMKGFKNEMQEYKIGMNIFKEEMRALRLDTNRHDKRITRLEHAIA